MYDENNLYSSNKDCVMLSNKVPYLGHYPKIRPWDNYIFEPIFQEVQYLQKICGHKFKELYTNDKRIMKFELNELQLSINSQYPIVPPYIYIKNLKITIHQYIKNIRNVIYKYITHDLYYIKSIFNKLVDTFFFQSKEKTCLLINKYTNTSKVFFRTNYMNIMYKQYLEIKTFATLLHKYILIKKIFSSYGLKDIRIEKYIL